MSQALLNELLEESKCLGCGGMSIEDRIQIALLRRIETSGTSTLASSAYDDDVSIQRPANTTDYTAGDAIGVTAGGAAGSAILEFENMGGANDLIAILDSRLLIELAAVPSGMTTFRLELYNAAPDAILDNAAWDLSSAGDRGKYLGFIRLGAPEDKGSTLFVQQTQLNKSVRLAGTSLFGVLVTDAGYTPASETVYKVSLLSVAL